MIDSITELLTIEPQRSYLVFKHIGNFQNQRLEFLYELISKTLEIAYRVHITL